MNNSQKKPLLLTSIIIAIILIIGCGIYYCFKHQNKTEVKTSPKEISYKMVPTSNNKGKYPQILDYSDKTIMDKVNASIAENFKEFGCPESASEDYWNVGVGVDYAKNDIFSVEMGGDYYCGGVHPTAFIYSFVFDMKSGEQVSFEKLFANYDNDKEKILKTIYADAIASSSAYIKSHPEIDYAYGNSSGECDDVNTFVNLSSWGQYYQLSSTTKSIIVYPDYPHVIQACEPTEEVSVEKLAPFINKDSILNRI